MIWLNVDGRTNAGGLLGASVIVSDSVVPVAAVDPVGQLLHVDVVVGLNDERAWKHRRGVARRVGWPFTSLHAGRAARPQGPLPGVADVADEPDHGDW